MNIPDFREEDLDGWKRTVSVYRYATSEWWYVFSTATLRVFIGRGDRGPKGRILDIIGLHAFFNWFVEPAKSAPKGHYGSENGYIHGHFLGVTFTGMAITICQLM